jgi:hypothetical protein
MQVTPQNAASISLLLENLAISDKSIKIPSGYTDLAWRSELMVHSTRLWIFSEIYKEEHEDRMMTPFSLTLEKFEAKQDGFASLNWVSAYSYFMEIPRN